MSAKPRALDLFCKAGGATKGLQRAGFHVTGVDIEPQPNYCGDEFIQADALGVSLEGFDFVWASPPCQAHTQLRGLGKAKASDVDLIPDVRGKLILWERGSWVIENVVGAPLRNPFTLCGSMFGLAVRRHRIFELRLTSRHPDKNVEKSITRDMHLFPPPCSCRARRNIAVYGKAPGHRLPDGVQRARSLEHGRDAMGIDWMTWPELTQAIPPAYSEYIGRAARSASSGQEAASSPREGQG